MTDIRKDKAALERAVVKMALAAEQVGLTADDLIRLLDSGHERATAFRVRNGQALRACC